jgi:hypothetical protein
MDQENRIGGVYTNDEAYKDISEYKIVTTLYGILHFLTQLQGSVKYKTRCYCVVNSGI